MNNFRTKYLEISKQILPRLHKLQSTYNRPIVVAIDGGSGSGKSTLASILAAQLNAALIPMDDFYAAHIPDHYWERFSVEERYMKCFDWERLRENTIKQLLAGEPACWYAFDFVSGIRSDGTYGMERHPKTLEPAAMILIDGNFSGAPQLADLVDFSILVDVPVAKRHARIAAREDPAFLQRWHLLWDPVEEYYLHKIRSKDRYDLVVSS